MFNLIKAIRNNELNELCEKLSDEIENIDQKWGGIVDFGLHGQNRKFVKHLLSRISGYVDEEIGKNSNYVDYHHPKGKQFEIEHIWADKFERHSDEFEQEIDFNNWRNSIGALILVPNGTNQAYKDAEYREKLKHYVKENTYAQTLCEAFYERNPNFLNSDTIQKLKFRPHPEFKKRDIEERTQLVQRICEEIWSTDHYLRG